MSVMKVFHSAVVSILIFSAAVDAGNGLGCKKFKDIYVDGSDMCQTMYTYIYEQPELPLFKSI